MAIGTISSPTTPIPLGTVASPIWASNVEDNINGLIAGTGPTLKALQIDGTGGASSSQPTGTIGASALSGGTSAPTASIARKNLYADMVPVAAGAVSGAGALISGFGISSITRNSTGSYTVVLLNGDSTSGANSFVIASLNSGTTNGMIRTGGSLGNSFNVLTVNSSAAATDFSFSFVFYVVGQ